MFDQDVGEDFLEAEETKFIDREKKDEVKVEKKD